MKRTFPLIALALCGAWLACQGCNGGPDPNGDGHTPDITAEQLIKELNLNSDSVFCIVSWSNIELLNSDNPQGRDAEAVFAFMKPGTIGLLVSKMNQNIVIVKTDGEVFDVYDYEKEEGWTGRVEHLKDDDNLFSFRPDSLAAAMALEHIEPENAEMATAEGGDYVLDITEPGRNRRKLHLARENLDPLTQEIFDDDDEVLIRVTYDKVTRVAVENGAIEVKVPSAVTLEGREEGSYLKIRNADPSKFSVNSERVFWNAIGNSVRVRFPEGVKMNILQPDGTWRPGE